MMIEIPLTLLEIPPQGVHLIIEVELQGVCTQMVVDTGASRTVVDLEFLSEITPDLSLQEEVESSTGVGSHNLKSYTATLSKLKIGELSLHQFEVAVLDLTTVKTVYQQLGATPVVGVLGGDILMNHHAVIDYSQKVLKLRANN